MCGTEGRGTRPHHRVGWPYHTSKHITHSIQRRTLENITEMTILVFKLQPYKPRFSCVWQTLSVWKHNGSAAPALHTHRFCGAHAREEKRVRGRELSRLVTHTAISSPKCNREKRPLSNSVAFRTLFKWHRYCGILKIHIISKTGIRHEPVYRPALVCPHFRIATYWSLNCSVCFSMLIDVKTSQ